MATLQSIAEKLNRHFHRIQSIRRRIEWRDEFIQRILERQLRIKYWLEEQPKRDRQSLMKLAQRGWFLGPHWPVSAIPKLGAAIVEEPDEVDMDVAQYIRGHLDNIEIRLVELYPRRSHLFTEGFWAHRQRRYALSIPVFLSQADGLFYDRFDKNLFMTKGRTEAVSDFGSEVIGLFFQAVLHPLGESIPLWEGTHYLEENFEGLNRHQVLHGIRMDYGTEINSLRAISFLDYLAWVLNRSAD